MAAERPEVFFLSLSMQGFFDESYQGLIDSISTYARMKRAKSANGAIRYLDANNPNAILVTDEGLTEPGNSAILEKVKLYFHNGGLVIVGLHFPNFTNFDDFNKLFQDFGLPWERGDYHRTTFQSNPASTLPAGVDRAKLPSAYSMKILHVKNARPHEKIFIPTPGGMTQSLVFPPAHVDETQAAIVGTKLGNGFLIYIGDVNPTKETDNIILTLCRL